MLKSHSRIFFIIIDNLWSLTSIDIAFWAVYGRSLEKEIYIIAFFALIVALKRKKGTTYNLFAMQIK
jgi:hypothetical protein